MSKPKKLRNEVGSTSEKLADPTNAAIVELLAVDGRVSFTELARRVHLSLPAVIARVRHLERSGVIRGYHADVDREALGLPVAIYAFLTCTRAMEGRFTHDLLKFPEITSCELVSGEPSFIVRACMASIEHVTEFLDRLGSYGETDSVIVLETLETPPLPVAHARDSSAGST